jgi:hypothetical protein
MAQGNRGVVRLRFFCCLWREERERPHAFPEEHRQNEGLAAIPWKSDATSPHDHKERALWRL